MKRIKVKKIIAVMLAFITMITAIPMSAVETYGATGTASLTVLGSLGTVNIGDKSESGTWLQTKVGGKAVFCRDLGKSCHTGYVYESSETTLSSDSKNTSESLKAKIGHWYFTTKDEHKYAWVYAQCLIWGVEEGVTSESGLKNIISQVKSNTGYYSSDNIYNDIFNIKDDVTCTIINWKYSGTADEKYVQRLMQIKSDKEEEEPPKFHSLSEKKRYRQRITLRKYGEDGETIPKVTFKLVAKNVKELYSFKANGWGNPESGDVDEDDTKFELILDTDSAGKITYKFDYQLQSEDYYYYNDSDLKDMDSNDKKEAKERLNKLGYSYASDLTKSGAEKLASKNLEKQFKDISNKYVITEVSTNDDDILLDSEFAKGKTITLSSSDSWWKTADGWPDTLDGTYSEYKLAYKLGVSNKYKKVSIKVNKVDSYANDKKAHGNASLDGAEFKLFADSSCKTAATVYTASGTKKTAGTYTVKNGNFETDYLKTGKSYFLKETKPPVGYLLNEEVKEIKVGGKNYNVEFTPTVQTIEAKEKPVLGKISITKIESDGSTGNALYEKGAVFQVYLKSRGSFDAANDTYERDTITTNSQGYAITKDLYYGTYIVHQVSTGGSDTKKVADFEVVVEENGKTYPYLLNNAPFKAYLKVVKKDKHTEKTVLKTGTKYQLYTVDGKGKETLYTQSYSNGKQMVTIDTFETDDEGCIMTVNPVGTGLYRIREIDSAPGLHITKDYIEVNVSSKNSDCVTSMDSDGNTFITISLNYYNEETQGKLTVMKMGEFLIGYGDDTTEEEIPMPVSSPWSMLFNNPMAFAMPMEQAISLPVEETQFIYNDDYLFGIEFEIYAAEDIVTQDNQGTNWFNKGDKVADFVTGEGATFTSMCNGLCESTVDDETGAVTVMLPLGKYTVRETKTSYGYLLPENPEWNVEFTWENKDQAYVVDKSDVTDEEGNLIVNNDRAKADVSIVKNDSKTNMPVRDTVFGFYTKDNIYASDGRLLVSADTLLTTVKTDENGFAKVELDLPMMSEGYSSDDDTEIDMTLNSGNYYFKELSISDSYYLDDEPIDIHVEYKNDSTPTIYAEAVQKNVQTEVEIDKRSVFGTGELAGCKLTLKDLEGEVIVSWITADKDSIEINETLDELGYRNFSAELNEQGSMIIKGLFCDTDYILSEECPADGFVTANDIQFALSEDETEESVTTTTVYILNEFDEYVKATENKVVMYDDSTKIEFSKTSITGADEIPGCELEVIDKETEIVMDKWTSTEYTHIVEGKYVVGKTYILSEKKAADGFTTATDIEFTIEDNGDIQKVEMKDDTTKVEFSKKASDTKKQLKGAKYKVFDSKGKEVYSFTTGKKAELIEGVFKVGETYTFKEIKAPKNYKLAEDKTITIKDTGKVQKLSAVDIKIPTVPDTPQTGFDKRIVYGVEAVLLVCLLYLNLKRRKKGKKDEKEQ